MEEQQEELKSQLQEAWHRWLVSCSYAQDHQRLTFLKKWCKYVVCVWNKAYADAGILREMFLGGSFFSSSITPARNVKIDYWAGQFSHDLGEVLDTSDLELDGDFIDFLQEEYDRMMRIHAKPMTLQEAAAKELSTPLFSEEWLAEMNGEEVFNIHTEEPVDDSLREM